ncbi:MAG: ankyrin repeat domain-containing protein [Sphingomicrobium sp.]
MIALKRLLLAISATAVAVPVSAQIGAYDGEKFVKAVREGNATEALKLLGETPTLVNVRDLSGRTALIEAIENRDTQWVGYLLQKEADPNLALRDGETPLIAAAKVGLVDVTRWLIERGARVDDTNRMGETALIVAVQRRQVPVARFLVDAGADPDKTDSAAGYSARDYAKRDTRTPELLRIIESKKPAS